VTVNLKCLCGSGPFIKPTVHVALSSHACHACIGLVPRVCDSRGFDGRNDPHSEYEGFLWGRIPACYVTKVAPRKAKKVIAQGKSTFDERFVLHHVACFSI